MKGRYFKYLIFFIAIITSVVFAVLLSTKKVEDAVIDSVSYVENDYTNYKVYYDNPFYNKSESLEEGKSYIRDNVNKIDVNFDYLLNFTDKVSGEYEYKMSGLLLVYEPGNPSNDYWSKPYDYKIGEKTTFKDKKTVEVKASNKINYQAIVNDYKEYKSSNQIATDAKAIISLVVSYTGEKDGVDKINQTKTIYLEIPVSQPTFSILKTNNLSTDTNVIVKNLDNSKKRELTRKLSIGLWGFAIVLGAIFIIVYNRDTRENSEYKRKLKKILNTYDSIIVNVDRLESLENVSIAKVSSFEELLDAQNEVRLPINYKEDKKKKMAKFILVRNNLAWVYVLKDGEKDEEKN